MGHRSYLYLKNQNRELYIFEANNSLPFFWLSFLDRQTLREKIQDWEKIKNYEETHSEDEIEKYLELNSNSIAISEQIFKMNSVKSRMFLQKHFPKTIPLFDDFIKFIKSKFEAHDNLKIDLTQISAFYNTLTDFYEAIDNELKAIETDNPENIKFLIIEDLIANGTGFEIVGNKEFSTYQTYQEAIKSRITPTYKSEQKFSKKSLITFIILLLFCPAFTLMAYNMYKQDGLTLPIVLIGILNIGFYYVCIWTIITEIKAYKRQTA
jgi:hypothetical protein